MEPARLKDGEPIPCKRCIQFEEALARAQRPYVSDMLLGLTEAGLRNHALQRQEQVSKAQEILDKHRKNCSIWKNLFQKEKS